MSAAPRPPTGLQDSPRRRFRNRRKIRGPRVRSFIGFELLIDAILRTRSGRIVLAVLACLSTTVAVMFLLPTGHGMWRLYRRPTLVSADVVDTQTFYEARPGGKATGHAVRYRFAVAERVYGFRGPAGNEWAYVPERVMDDAARDRRIDVAYEAADPPNNLPAVKLTWLWAWAVGLMAAPVVLAAAAWAWVARVARDERRLRQGG